MVVSATTELDCIVWGDTSGRTSYRRTTVLIAHPVCRRLILSLYSVGKSIVDEAHAATPIRNELEIGFSIQWFAR